MAVAGIFARLGGALTFLNDKGEGQGKHVEFIARFERFGVDVAVEAKSRHRPGVINHPGQIDMQRSRSGDVSAMKRLLSNAFEKRPEEPYLVFFDANAPLEPQPAGFFNEWQEAAKEAISDLMAVHDGSSPCERIVFTNFSPHYVGDDLSTGSEWMWVKPDDSDEKIPPVLYRDLQKALRAYHSIPEIVGDPEFLR